MQTMPATIRVQNEPAVTHATYPPVTAGMTDAQNNAPQ